MADQQEPVFQIQRVYLKEASLEQPNSPAILLEQEQPSVDIQLGVEAAPVADGVYEVCVTATVHDPDQGQDRVPGRGQAGRHFRNPQCARRADGPDHGHRLPADRLSLPARQCGRPRARAGFPPVHLAEINFQSMYEQQQQAQQDAEPSRIITTA